MKKTLLFLCSLLVLTPLRADEGMWLPILISERIADMQAKGCRLSAEDIYSVNQASLKDAIVLFGGGCTAELVSDAGLLLTNHHCGFSYIQRHSSVEHDYLKDGFWALSRSEELPNPGLSVRFLERMEDVTETILAGCDDSMSEQERAQKVRERSQALTEQVTAEGKGLAASVEALYYGNQYFLFVYRVYRDVRLVGAPPSAIGKFGGDTDNWMWPRHTGDFSIFRIYADANNDPADYSPDNVPYHPRKFFKISTSGVKDGDFTFVYGCPGSTQEYAYSGQVRYISEVSDPAKIGLRTQRLDIQKKYMNADPAVRIQYAAKNATTANAWKKWQGEVRGLRRLGTVAAKEAYEKRLAKKSRILPELSALYDRRLPAYYAYEVYTESIRSIELLNFASGLQQRLGRGEDIRSYAEAFYKDYYQPLDEEIFVAMLGSFHELLHGKGEPVWFDERLAAFPGESENEKIQAWKDSIYEQSLLTDPERVLALCPADRERLAQDPALRFWQDFLDWYRDEVYPRIQASGEDLSRNLRLYMREQMAFEPKKAFYPDANLTLRIAYGQVAGYAPADGIRYRSVSTLKGIMEKDNPDIYDYNIPQTLRDIYAAGGVEDMPVCFLATNHTSGGNSGSPVINADGQLIGINFDRVWEGTMSDLAYDPVYCRNISLDIRYLLFVVDRIGGASYLFDEMEFVKE